MELSLFILRLPWTPIELLSSKLRNVWIYWKVCKSSFFWCTTVIARKQPEPFLNDFDTGEQTNKQVTQRLNDKRCYPCHAQRVEQSYIDATGRYFAIPVLAGSSREFNDLVNDYNNGNYGCIELDLIFAQTVTDGIDIGKHWLLFHKPQTAPNVTAVYRVHTAEYPQSSLNLNHSWQKTDKKNLNAGLNLLQSAP